jgi:hypothetical protein
MSIDIDQAFERFRKCKVFDFWKSRRLTEDLVCLLEGVCDRYASGSDEDRANIRSRVSKEFSFLFFMFCSLMVEKAVQQQSQECLKKGLVALLIEDGEFDWRENMGPLSKAYHSACLLGLPAKEFFLSMMWLAGPGMGPVVRGFLEAEPAIRSISAFGWQEGTNAEGQFAYVPLHRQNSIRAL